MFSAKSPKTPRTLALVFIRIPGYCTVQLRAVHTPGQRDYPTLQCPLSIFGSIGACHQLCDSHQHYFQHTHTRTRARANGSRTEKTIVSKIHTPSLRTKNIAVRQLRSDQSTI